MSLFVSPPPRSSRRFRRLICWLVTFALLLIAVLPAVFERISFKSQIALWIFVSVLLLFKLFAWVPAVWLGNRLRMIACVHHNTRLWYIGDLCCQFAHDHFFYQLLATCFGYTTLVVFSSRCPSCENVVDPFVPHSIAEQLDGTEVKCPMCHHQGRYRLVRE